ncbi:MAG: Hsp20/alpha crystallin family protein [Nitrososphaerota archaeon]
MQASKDRRIHELRPMTVTLLVIVMLVMVILALRLQRGFIGIVLVVATAFILFYWMIEVRKMLKRSGLKDFIYEVLDEGDCISIIAQVPGPEDAVNVLTLGKRIIIKGGGGFKRTLVLPHKVELMHKSYKNGVLALKMQKL